jgi:hypothetical protein
MPTIDLETQTCDATIRSTVHARQQLGKQRRKNPAVKVNSQTAITRPNHPTQRDHLSQAPFWMFSQIAPGPTESEKDGGFKLLLPHICGVWQHGTPYAYVERIRPASVFGSANQPRTLLGREAGQALTHRRVQRRSSLPRVHAAKVRNSAEWT